MAAPAFASSYTVTGLGSLGFGTTVATAINASGQITGESYLGSEVQIPCTDRRHKGPCFTHPAHAFRWSDGTMTLDQCSERRLPNDNRHAANTTSSARAL